MTTKATTTIVPFREGVFLGHHREFHLLSRSAFPPNYLFKLLNALSRNPWGQRQHRLNHPLSVLVSPKILSTLALQSVFDRESQNHILRQTKRIRRLLLCSMHGQHRESRLCQKHQVLHLERPHLHRVHLASTPCRNRQSSKPLPHPCASRTRKPRAELSAALDESLLPSKRKGHWDINSTPYPTFPVQNPIARSLTASIPFHRRVQ